MIANRFNPLGVSSKPYDAEVEYLESTGTQWIDTGIILSSETDEIDATLYVVNNRVSQVIFGSRLSVGSQNIGCGFGLELDLFVDVCDKADYSTWRAGTTKGAPSGLYSVHVSRKARTISGVVSASNTTLSDIFVTYYNCYLFSGAGNFWTTNRFIGRFYSFRIKRNGTPILVLIPVRVGDVGYMFDRVSGKLFGNKGKGQFILGADK